MTTSDGVTIQTAYGVVTISAEAAKVIESFDTANQSEDDLANAFFEDVAALRDGDKTAAQLREECLEWAQGKHVSNWNAWVDAVVTVAGDLATYPDPVE